MLLNTDTDKNGLLWVRDN